MISFRIRPALEPDFLQLPEIEADAALLFAEGGLSSVASMAPTPASYYASLIKPCAIFVAETSERSLAGFTVAFLVDGQAYLREVSVRRAHAGQGVGRKLVETIIGWAREKGFTYLALTTFRDLPFNAPFYTKMGFEIFEPDEAWPELVQIRAKEEQVLLSVAPRVAMKLPLA